MNNILSVLDSFTFDNADDIAKGLADDFRKRRIEKNLTREQIAERSGVAISNITRFEQKGLVSLKNLIALAMAMDYTSEIKNIFSQPKYSTMEELTQIRKNTGKTKAYKKNHDKTEPKQV
ncbi:helix-turn-helix transcriptional regulator [Bacteroides caecigallinarum]|uniref:helix-turn-helix domain-containing protein n=1 Tax=Bacteroides caecigallinarum TaxID=1411144 RepID=UPI001F196058|nr:helix-turn-helix transcriptional regulator [Bacteroides caecigallinarum]MCF2738258.1 helix-turn-helix transcriptional regulator [Bacteroides caecigallinarum]MDN0051653.1 helix-turn-helix transcriptional regulator [Bacteroides caecigallinarum]MDN0071317.1 helix-turn-helix transcriptional regulator [Bacteroides caecigallinarum]